MSSRIALPMPQLSPEPESWISPEPTIALTTNPVAAAVIGGAGSSSATPPMSAPNPSSSAMNIDDDAMPELEGLTAASSSSSLSTTAAAAFPTPSPPRITQQPINSHPPIRLITTATAAAAAPSLRATASKMIPILPPMATATSVASLVQHQHKAQTPSQVSSWSAASSSSSSVKAVNPFWTRSGPSRMAASPIGQLLFKQSQAQLTTQAKSAVAAVTSASAPPSTKHDVKTTPFTASQPARITPPSPPLPSPPPSAATTRLSSSSRVTSSSSTQHALGTAASAAAVSTSVAPVTSSSSSTRPYSYAHEFDDLDDYTDEQWRDAETVTHVASACHSPTAAAASSLTVQSSIISQPTVVPKFTHDALYASSVEVLKKFWGFSTFRTGQFDLIEAVASYQRDTFVLMATGQGKSICFQLLPLVTGKPVIVISPLISLMQDQVLGLRARSINACALTSENSDPQVTRDAMDGKYALIYMSPERLALSFSQLQTLDNRVGITCFAIDESHCISEWGSDFRPEYRNLGRIRHNFPTTPIMALTATATRHVCDDIQAQLNLKNTLVVRTTYNRPNLYHEVRMATDVKRDFTRQLLGDGKTSCIVYVQTKADTETVATHLQSIGISAHAYHAGLPVKQKEYVHQSFLRQQIRVVVATVAFGMGIDMLETRKVICYGLLKNIESLVQMTGRAGRDGQSAECILFYSRADYGKSNFWKMSKGKRSDHHQQHDTSDNPADRLRKSVISKALDKIQAYVSSTRCRRVELLEYFDEDWRVNALTPDQAQKGVIDHDGYCGNCDNCLASKRGQAENVNGTAAASSSASSSSSAAVARSLSAQPTINNIDTAHMYWLALCVHETAEKFGLSFISQFLKGSQAKKITDRENWFRVKPLSACQSYGKLKLEPVSYIQALARYLVNLQVLVYHNSNDYQIIKLGPAGRRLLELGEKNYSQFQPTGNTNLTPELRSEIEAKKRAHDMQVKNKTARALAMQQANDAAALHHANFSSMVTANNRTPMDSHTSALLDVLTALRTELAKEKAIPPYTIFQHTELISFATYRPTSIASMSSFAGVTTTKLAQYGLRFCQAIAAFASEKGVTTDLPLLIDQQQSALTPSMNTPPSGRSLGVALTYVEYLVRVRATGAADQIRSTICDWTSFPPSPLTRVRVVGTPNFVLPNPKGAFQQQSWLDWTAGRSPSNIASSSGKSVDSILKALAAVMKYPVTYDWHRFNIPDAPVQKVQDAIMRAEAVAFQQDKRQVLSDPHDVGLWPVPYLRTILEQLPGGFTLEFGLLDLIITHLRRLYGVMGPTRSSQPAATVAAAAVSSHTTVSQDNHDDDDNTPLEDLKPSIDLMQFRSRYVSPTKKTLATPYSSMTSGVAVRSEPTDTVHSIGVPPAAISLPRRSLSEYMNQQRGGSALAAPDATIVKTPSSSSAATSSSLRPLYSLSTRVDSSRVMTNQKIRVLELFEKSHSISQISSQLTLRTSTIIQFLSDAILAGYELDSSRLAIAHEDEGAIMRLLPSTLPSDAMSLSITHLIPYITQLKKHPSIREECTKESILLIINKYMQQQYLNQLQEVPPICQTEVVVPMEDVDSLPPLEHAPPIDLTSPPLSTHTTSTTPSSSPLTSRKRKVDEFIAQPDGTPMIPPSQSVVEKKQRIDKESIPAAAAAAAGRSTHTSPQSMISSPMPHSPLHLHHSSIHGGRHTAASHPIGQLQSLTPDVTNDGDERKCDSPSRASELSSSVPVVGSPSTTTVTSSLLPPLNTASIFRLLQSSASGLRLDELGAALIPKSALDLWSQLVKLQTMLTQLAEDGSIFKQGELFKLL